MNTMKIGAIAMAVAITVSSCSSYRQASAGTTGAWIGGNVGEVVGAIAGHGPFRGHNAALGRLVGMGVGAVLGVSVASHIERNQQKKYEERQNAQRVTDGYSAYNESADYQTGGGAYSEQNVNVGTTIYGAQASNGIENTITLSPLTYTDSNGDGYISRNEVCEIEGFVTNNTSQQLENVNIAISSDSNNRDFFLSPMLTTTLSPGQKVRYTGRVICRKAHRGQSLNIGMTVTTASGAINSGVIQIPVK